jgi:hypothetical protein
MVYVRPPPPLPLRRSQHAADLLAYHRETVAACRARSTALSSTSAAASSSTTDGSEYADESVLDGGGDDGGDDGEDDGSDEDGRDDADGDDGDDDGDDDDDDDDDGDDDLYCDGDGNAAARADEDARTDRPRNSQSARHRRRGGREGKALPPLLSLLITVAGTAI